MHGSVKRGDVSLMFGLIDPNNPHDQAPLGRGFALYTTVADDEDIDALFQHASAAGATVVQEPMDQFWGHRDWTVADPDGYRIVVSKVIAQVSEQDIRDAMLAGQTG
jgi:PhnB protein